ncbi:carbohydrate-binding module family 18 protein [Baudoinia panamericana UAMH 10762]|uniref:Carbohydrate-binding module family 18 protein n=1 Tax=Baudoinia panamericana (strain UAMH 10762) TaxID=717646 RepID=M2LT97_BAUPA|nr:carbohydrate-binding module family 18 protein [Baudoinia panamericana UAMH 10762]EMC97752.1 carbohydrate-binding module family 18 protein [Baudoinia panamericana UAMH 10762]
MKAPLLILAGSTTFTTANIVFNFVQSNCDHTQVDFTGCLRGQTCLENNTCVPSESVIPTIRYRDTTPPRSDGRCGSAFDGATCDPNAAYGGCCSEAGWCGTTSEHCLLSNGCQSGCTDAASTLPTSTGTPPTSAAQPNSVNVGTLNSEPVIAPTKTAGAQPSGAATTDGTCGATNSNTICGNWPFGGCCSMYGYCGNTAAHCGAGCQSGPCLQAPVAPVPNASPAPMNANPGSFNIVGQSGVPAMHAAVLPNGRVVFLDKIEDYTQVKLPNSQYAYSSEYDPVTNTYVPLAYESNAFCSGGSFLANGTLLNIGGNANLSWLDPTVGDGWQAIRYLSRSLTDASLDGQSWNEPGNKLNSARWYPTAQTLADGRIFVASGSLNGLDPTVLKNNNPTYEILSAGGESESVKAQPYFMYPFIHLLRDGTLFVFTSKSSVRFNAASNNQVTSYPDLPGDYRTYPNTGGSVLLPLSSANEWTSDIITCGGGAYQDITSPTDPSCGRMSPLGAAPEWEMDSMPSGRGMVEGILLPDGTVLWLNGAQKGAEGFNLATDPALEMLIYDPDQPLGRRWTTGAGSTIPRLYHSVALLLLDGTVLVAGSNPDQMPVVAPVVDPQGFNTEFRVEIYTPPYLSGANADRRPTDITLSTTKLTADASKFQISFTAPAGAQAVKVALYHGGFVTHAVHMSQRMLFLDSTGWQASSTKQILTVTSPPDNNVAPPGPYVVYVVVDGVPGVGQFVMMA